MVKGKIGGRKRKSPKRLGISFEREITKALEKWGAKRIVGSGSFAGAMRDPTLAGDIEFYCPWWSRPFKGEAKHGYGGAKKMTIAREWFQKIREEAREDDGKIPCVIWKFKGVTSADQEERDSAKVIAFNLDTFQRMLDEIEEWWDIFQMLVERYYKDDSS